MLVRYQNVPPDLRDDVRSVNDKGHVPYIIYLMLKRFPIDKIPSELLKLNLHSVDAKKMQVFFNHALFPLLKSQGYEKMYETYSVKYDDDRMEISSAFPHSDIERKEFIKNILIPTGCIVFFSEEIRKFYRGVIPTDDKGNPLFKKYSSQWQDILSHEKRYVIDNFLAEGRSADDISEHFKSVHNEIINPKALTAYSEGFMNSKLYNVAKMISDLEKKLVSIEESIKITKDDQELTYGEKSVIISQLKKTENQINAQLKKTKSLHNSGAFSTSRLEYTNIRDILDDILQRTHRRFVMMDRRTDDDVINNLSKLASTVDRMTARIFDVDEVASSVETRSITEEMLEVITPTLDRIESEEEEAIRQYEMILGIDRPEEAEKQVEEIIGFE